MKILTIGSDFEKVSRFLRSLQDTKISTEEERLLGETILVTDI